MAALKLLRLVPDRVKVEGSPARITLEVHLGGRAADVEEWFLMMVSPSRSDKLLFTANPVREVPPETNGVFLVLGNLPAGSETGTWKVGYIWLKSSNGDTTVIDPETFPLQLTVL